MFRLSIITGLVIFSTILYAQEPASVKVNNLLVEGILKMEELQGQGQGHIGVNNQGRLGLINDTFFLSFTALKVESNIGISTNFGSQFISCRPTEPGAGDMWIELNFPTRDYWNDTMLVHFIDGAVANMTFTILAVAHDGSGLTSIGTASTIGNQPGIVRSMGIPLTNMMAIDPQHNHFLLKNSSNNWNGNSLQFIGGYMYMVL